MDVEFGPDQRKFLGLTEDQSVRVLSSGPRTILLERIGDEGAGVYPWDRDLVLSADVRAFALADVLQLIHGASKSGFLSFEHGDHRKSVYLKRGEVIFAASNQPVDRLGQYLLRSGVLTQEQFREATQAFSPSTHYGKLLVERGFLTSRQIWHGVKAQVEEIVRSLFSYAAGTVLFWEGEVQPDNVVRLALPTSRLIDEGLAHRSELLRFLTALEDPEVRLEVEPGAELTGTERAVYEALQAEPAFGPACHRAEVDPLSGARTIQLLRLMGIIRVERCRSVPPASGSEDADRGVAERSLRRCIDDHLRVLAELSAPIVAVEGGQGFRERLSGVAEDASSHFTELFDGIEIGSNGSLDPEELFKRAARFPGDRENEVRMALGELVSYVEFDLLNHPQIPDAETFLEDVEQLRALL